METALIKKVAIRKRFYEPTILQCFLDADLRGSHNHLTEIGKRHNLDLLNLLSGQVVIFINKRRTLMKCFVEGNTFSFTRRDHIDLSAISKLPQAFGCSGELSYDKALELSLMERLGKPDKKEPLTEMGKSAWKKQKKQQRIAI